MNGRMPTSIQLLWRRRRLQGEVGGDGGDGGRELGRHAGERGKSVRLLEGRNTGWACAQGPLFADRGHRSLADHPGRLAHLISAAEGLLLTSKDSLFICFMWSICVMHRESGERILLLPIS
jgi:hypothetical protein